LQSQQPGSFVVRMGSSGPILFSPYYQLTPLATAGLLCGAGRIVGHQCSVFDRILELPLLLGFTIARVEARPYVWCNSIPLGRSLFLIGVAMNMSQDCRYCVDYDEGGGTVCRRPAQHHHCAT
jgi:hypothetical protein